MQYLLNVNAVVGSIFYLTQLHLMLSDGDYVDLLPSSVTGVYGGGNGSSFLAPATTHNGVTIDHALMLTATNINATYDPARIDSYITGFELLERVDENSLSTAIKNETTLPINTPVSPTPTLTPEEQSIADKARLATITAQLKANVQIIDDDSIFYMLGGSSAKTTAVMNVLDNGGGFADIVALNLAISDATILRVLAVYLVRVDTVRFQNESGIDLINSYARLKSFTDFLAVHGLAVPSLDSIKSVLRSNPTTFNAARDWAATNPV